MQRAIVGKASPQHNGVGKGVYASLVIAGFAVCLQGCGVSIPYHYVGNWQMQQSYLEAYAYEPFGSADVSRGPRLNSCSSSESELPVALRCSGHGRCVDWFDLQEGNQTTSRLSFCQCDFEWSGPECGKQRKSQLTAFVLSLFLGYLGADQFYLGFWLAGLFKLFSLGGCGIWWIYDIVRVGSSPVHAADSFRVSANVEHFAFVLTVVTFMGFLGFAISCWSISYHRAKAAQEVMLRKSMPAFGYGSATPSMALSPVPAVDFQRPATVLSYPTRSQMNAPTSSITNVDSRRYRAVHIGSDVQAHPAIVPDTGVSREEWNSQSP